MPSDTPSKAPAILGELEALVAKAKAGDASVLPRLRAILDDHPEILDHIGGLERSATRAWAEAISDGGPLTLEVTERQAAKMRADLEGEDPTPIERLLIGNIVMTWLEVSHAQLQMAGGAQRTAPQASVLSKQADSAGRRHLAAVKTLATVRALMPRGLMPASRLKVFVPESKSG